MSTRSRRFSVAVSEGLKTCAPQAQLYGACIKAVLPEVEKGVCEREFQALKGCMRQALRASLARTK